MTRTTQPRPLRSTSWLPVVIALAVVASLAPRTAVASADTPQLLSLDTVAPLRRALPQYVIRETPVAVDWSLLGGLDSDASRVASALMIQVDDLAIAAELERVIENRSGSLSWVGSVIEEPGSQVIFVSRGGNLTASIRSRGRFFEIRQVDGGYHVLREIDETSPSLQEMPPTEVTSSSPELPATLETPTPTPQGDGGGTTTIDLMVVYTSGAVSAAGGTITAIENRIDLGVTEANIGYGNSFVDIEMNLVRTALVTYNDSGSASTDRDRLRATNDGFLDEVHGWRDDYGADIVQMIIGSGGCGIAYIMTNVGPGFASSAFCVTQESCISPNYTFSHEMGHLQAARHNYEADPAVNSPYAFNHGYQSPTNAWRTIMSYNCSPSCQRQLYWSNPDVLHPSTNEPMGIPDGQPLAADNRLTLNSTASTVAAFRTSAALIFANGFESGNTTSWSNP